MSGASTTSKPHILLLQGPNMNFLGRRQPELYGHTSSSELDRMLQEHASEKNYTLTIYYTNSEGSALDRLYQAFDEGVSGLVMNPAAWSHAGHSLRYCLEGIGLPYVEVHLRNQYKMRLVSTLADLAVGVVQGFGIHSYILGMEAMLSVLRQRRAPGDR